MKFLYCKFLIFCMVLSDQRTPYSTMYVWAAFEAKSPPTRQDLVTLLHTVTKSLCKLILINYRTFEYLLCSPTVSVTIMAGFIVADLADLLYKTFPDIL